MPNANKMEAERRWPSFFRRMERVVARTGVARMSADPKSPDPQLGSWATVQRQKYRLGLLSRAHQTALEQLPGWTWDRDATNFTRGIDAARAFAVREEHLQLPERHVEAGVYLTAWRSNVRSRRRKGRLTAAQCAACEAVPHWTWGKTLISKRLLRDQTVTDGLIAAMKTCGHVRGPFPPVVAAAVYAWRAAYRRGVGPSAARIRWAEKLPGWTWELTSSQAQSAACLAAVGAFAARHGHTRIPFSYRPGGLPVGTWVRRQRAPHRLAGERLSPQVRRALNAIPGWTWDPMTLIERDPGFVKMVAALRAFRVGCPQGPIPRTVRVGRTVLADWAAGQKDRITKGTMGTERLAILAPLIGGALRPPSDLRARVDALPGLWAAHRHRLSAREQEMVARRYGLGRDAERLPTIAASLCPPISRERVRQIAHRGVHKLGRAADAASALGAPPAR